MTISDDQGPLDLSTATTITFIARNLQTKLLKMQIPCTADVDQVNNKGKCYFTATKWSPTDVDTSGAYAVEVTITWSNGAKSTHPADADDKLILRDDVDNA